MWASWGGYPRVAQQYKPVSWQNELSTVVKQVKTQQMRGDRAEALTVLPVGLRRSYGDSCINSRGVAISMNSVNRFLNFDSTIGIVECEAGVSLDQILRFFVPQGWFLPVVPGTKFITVGGAIANDVHGKNHHVGGTFGRHVRSLLLMRSDGAVLRCSQNENEGLFRATIGGLGLTGTIISAEVALKPITSAYIEQISEKFTSLDEFFEVSDRLSRDHAYTVAWIDCISGGEEGRGIFMAGNTENTEKGGGYDDNIANGQIGLRGDTKNLKRLRRTHRDPLVSVPFTVPEWMLSPLTMKLFNSAYYHKQQAKVKNSLIHYDPFFFPLDSVGNWNRLYGKRGFLQFQCVSSREVIREVLREVVKSQAGSLLAVLKEFGSLVSPGILSFPKPGVTLALDFPFRGRTTEELFLRLATIVCEGGGRMYPAKDALMTSEQFLEFYPNLSEFLPFVDPLHSSDFARRVHLV